MPEFSKLSLSQFLAALASPDPTPGGGTASAIAGAMGVALLVMVSGLPKSRTNGDEERTALAAARAALDPLGHRLRELADQDSAAYDQVTAAYRMPKDGDDQKAARAAAIQHALAEATRVPLETLETCVDAIIHGAAVARFGHLSAASDVGVGLGLLEAAGHGAAANVRINIEGLKDAAQQARFNQGVADAVEALRGRLAEARAATGPR